MYLKINYHAPTQSLVVKSPNQQWHFTREAISAFVLVVVYAVGLVCLHLPFRDSFVLLTPYNLLFSLAVVLLNHTYWTARFIVTAIFCSLAGYASEVIGVQTGLIFGNYEYGATLGLQLFDVPLVLAVNWFVLLYCSAMIVNHFWKRYPMIIKALVGAALMVALDVLIEPVAMMFDFWMWEGGIIPLQNYIGWFVIAFVLQLLLISSLPKDHTNHIGVILFVLQAIFFGVLNFSV